MAQDIALVYDNEMMQGDIELNSDGNDLLADNGLTTAVYISLFTDARADEDDAVVNDGELRGWWADLTMVGDKIGSRLWLLDRAKTTPSTVAAAVEYAEEALQWMVDDGVVARIECAAERQKKDNNTYMLALRVTLYHADGKNTVLEFNDLWEAQFGI
jgi:phage gp46-like protein